MWVINAACEKLYALLESNGASLQQIVRNEDEHWHATAAELQAGVPSLAHAALAAPDVTVVNMQHSSHTTGSMRNEHAAQSC